MILCELPTEQLDRLDSCSRVLVQQETCGDKKNSIRTKLQKASMER